MVTDKELRDIKRALTIAVDMLHNTGNTESERLDKAIGGVNEAIDHIELAIKYGVDK